MTTATTTDLIKEELRCKQLEMDLRLATDALRRITLVVSMSGATKMKAIANDALDTLKASS